MLNQTIRNQVINNLKGYFSQNSEIVLAYLFGSFATNKFCRESDIDIAVYLSKEDAEFENRIWQELEKILKREVELIVLNRAKPIIAWQVIKKGIPLAINNRTFFLSFMLEVSNEAEDLLDFNLDAFRQKEALFGKTG